MTCDELAERLTDFLEGDLNAYDEQSAIEHVATCTSCETVLKETQLVIGLSNQHGAETLDELTRSRLLDTLAQELDEIS